MLLNPARVSAREKLILAGLFLAKYDSAGLKRLGFKGFQEAFSVIGYALGAKPASIKNYRDEFDPLVSRRRKGWHHRPTREYCLKVYEEYKNLDIDAFTSLVRSFAGQDENVLSEVQQIDGGKAGELSFAKRLITGLAAEQYFESVQPDLAEFADFELENTTRIGCGYDFRLWTASRKDVLAIEVKGLREVSGGLSLTPKEYQNAESLGERFYLFVVKNFRDTPFHEIYCDPLRGKLQFTKKERIVISISYLTNV